MIWATSMIWKLTRRNTSLHIFTLKEAFEKGKQVRVEKERDVIVYEGTLGFGCCLAETFFSKERRKIEQIVCYLSHPNSSKHIEASISDKFFDFQRSSLTFNYKRR